MKVNKVDLLEALDIVKPGLAAKEIIESSTSFAFLGDRVVTYNDEISISHPVTGLELRGAVKAEQLYALLKKITKEEIEITITDTEAILSSGRLKAGLALHPEIRLPLDEEIAEKGDWQPLPELFVKHMSFAMSSCSSSLSSGVLTCVHVTQEGIIEASDGQRFTHCNLTEEMPVPTFLIPAGSVETMVKLNPTEVAEGNGWVHFKTEAGTILSCRILADNYVNTAKLSKITGTKIDLPKVTNSLLERASVFAKRDHALDESVTITLENNRFKIRAEAEAGWIEEEVNFKYTGTPVTFNITPYLLRGILAETLSCILGEGALKFEGENWFYITRLRNK